jgi:pilus assembly protein CpaC
VDRTEYARWEKALIKPRSVCTSACILLVAILALPFYAAAQGLVRIDVTIGKSQIIELKDPFTRVSVTNPSIADVFVVTPTQILVNGKAVGVTSLVVFYPGRTMFFDLAVQTDLGLLRERLKEIAPQDDITVQPLQDAIVLSGTVSSQRLVGGAQEVAAAFAPRGRIVNLLTVAPIKTPQVMLQVHVAQASREALRELGFSIQALGRVFTGAAFSSLVPGSGGFAPGFFGGTSTVTGPARFESPQFNLSDATFFLSSAQRDYAGIVRALSDRGLVRTLAKPNLVTESGREARFLSGGEFPYPVAQGNGAVSVEWKPFGVGLVFTPVILDGETISLEVRPEVSTLDFSREIQGAGVVLPVVRKDEAFTHINLKDGESFAIAGLINEDVTKRVSKIPVLGDIPIIGALFRTTRFSSEERELLFLVTVKQVRGGPPGSPSVPDPLKLMEQRPEENKEFTLVPGIPGVGELIQRPFGESNLLGPTAPPGIVPNK